MTYTARRPTRTAATAWATAGCAAQAASTSASSMRKPSTFTCEGRGINEERRRKVVRAGRMPHLIVHAPHKHQRTVAGASADVAGAVDAVPVPVPVPRGEGVGQEAHRRQVRRVQVARGHADAADPQLALLPRPRQRRKRGVGVGHEVEGGRADGRADGDARAGRRGPVARQEVAGGPDGGLGRAVNVAQGAAAARQRQQRGAEGLAADEEVDGGVAGPPCRLEHLVRRRRGLGWSCGLRDMEEVRSGGKWVPAPRSRQRGAPRRGGGKGPVGSPDGGKYDDGVLEVSSEGDGKVSSNSEAPGRRAPRRRRTPRAGTARAC